MLHCTFLSMKPKFRDYTLKKQHTSLSCCLVPLPMVILANKYVNCDDESCKLDIQGLYSVHYRTAKICAASFNHVELRAEKL